LFQSQSRCVWLGLVSNRSKNANLTKKTDARGIYSTYTYDSLNRNTEINYSDTLLSPDVKRFYDGATGGKGRFWYDYKGGETAANNVEALGRPLTKQQASSSKLLLIFFLKRVALT